jgi:hypothetical protein
MQNTKYKLKIEQQNHTNNPRWTKVLRKSR